MTKTIVEALTIKNSGDVAADNADPPEVLETIPVYREFFAEHEKFQRIHVHLVGLRVRDPSEDSNAGVFKASWFKTPKLQVETYGEDTGSTDYFPIGKHNTLVSGSVFVDAVPSHLAGVTSIFTHEILLVEISNEKRTHTGLGRQVCRHWQERDDRRYQNFGDWQERSIFV
jgi:hypothetical protein